MEITSTTSWTEFLFKYIRCNYPAGQLFVNGKATRNDRTPFVRNLSQTSYAGLVSIDHSLLVFAQHLLSIRLKSSGDAFPSLDRRPDIPHPA